MVPCRWSGYSPALTDFVFMSKTSSYMFVTGPEVVKTVTHEEVKQDELGGAKAHNTVSGVSDCRFDNDLETLLRIRKLFNYLPASNKGDIPDENNDPIDRIDTALNTLVLDNSNLSYDMLELIERVVIMVSFLSVSEYAKNIIVGFGRLDGKTVGFAANNPMYLAGCLDINASVKC